MLIEKVDVPHVDPSLFVTVTLKFAVVPGGTEEDGPLIELLGLKRWHGGAPPPPPPRFTCTKAVLPSATAVTLTLAPESV